MLKKIRNFFYKDTRVVVKPGPHMEATHEVSMANPQDYHMQFWRIKKTYSEQEWPVKIGTYSIISVDNIVDPIEAGFWSIVKLIAGPSVDVSGQIVCDGVKPKVTFAADNPMIGKPSFSIKSENGVEVYKRRFSEGDEFVFNDNVGHNIHIRRNGDSSYKEWTITIDP